MPEEIFKEFQGREGVEILKICLASCSFGVERVPGRGAKLFTERGSGGRKRGWCGAGGEAEVVGGGPAVLECGSDQGMGGAGPWSDPR